MACEPKKFTESNEIFIFQLILLACWNSTYQYHILAILSHWLSHIVHYFDKKFFKEDILFSVLQRE